MLISNLSEINLNSFVVLHCPSLTQILGQLEGTFMFVEQIALLRTFIHNDMASFILHG